MNGARLYATHRRLSWCELPVIPKVATVYVASLSVVSAVAIAGWHRADVSLWLALGTSAFLLVLPFAFLEFARRLYGTELHYGVKP